MVSQADNVLITHPARSGSIFVFWFFAELGRGSGTHASAAGGIVYSSEGVSINEAGGSSSSRKEGGSAKGTVLGKAVH